MPRTRYLLPFRGDNRLLLRLPRLLLLSLPAAGGPDRNSLSPLPTYLNYGTSPRCPASRFTSLEISSLRNSSGAGPAQALLIRLFFLLAIN